MNKLSILNDYLSVSNLKSLLNDVNSHISDKKINTDSVQNVKKFIFDVMNTIHQDERIKNMNLNDINNKTIIICKKLLDDISKKTQTINSQLIDSKQNKEPFIDSIIPQSTSQMKGQFKNVENVMESFISERDHDLIDKKKPVEQNVTQPFDNDQVINEDEFKSYLEKMQSEREHFQNEIALSQPMTTIDFENVDLSSFKITDNNLSSSQSSLNNNNDKDNKISDNTTESSITKICVDIDASNPFQRDIDSKIQQKEPIEEIHPKAFYQDNNNINDIMNSKVLMKPGGPSDDINQILLNMGKNSDGSHKVNKIDKTHFILINSFDRNWIVDNFRYKYSIKFTNSLNSSQQVPYYENNPTVPYTKSDDNSGVPNSMGWTDRFGEFHEPYNYSEPLGNIIGYEDLELLTDQDSNLSKFTNVHSIKITNVTIPIEFFFQHVNSVNVNTSRDHSFNFNFPYILLNIDEFNDIYDGTDNSIRKCFCQLQYDNHFTCPNGRGYIILKPVQDESKIFYPTPLSILPTLHISLTKPNGELLNTNKDGIKVLAVQNIQTYYLRVTTTTFFNKDSFMIGDFVRFKNFNIFNINSSTNSNNNNITLFNSFINQSKGHEIIQIGEPNNDGYYNSFNIFAPGHFDDLIGKFVVDTPIVDTLAEFNNVIASKNILDDPTTNNDYDNGFILNMSLQNSISITIQTKIVDSSLVASD